MLKIFWNANQQNKKGQIGYYALVYIVFWPTSGLLLAASEAINVTVRRPIQARTAVGGILQKKKKHLAVYKCYYHYNDEDLGLRGCVV